MVAMFSSGGAIHGWVVRLIKEWRYRADIHKLHGMSDRQLRDIGLGRSQIEDAVRGETPAQADATGKLRTIFHP
jgi:uncharacterized protein YjiS (DUF1127 family)